MKFRPLFSILLVVCLVFFTAACGGGGGGGDDDNKGDLSDVIAFLDIVDAKSVYIGSNPSLAKSSGVTITNKSSQFDQKKLLKITDSNLVEEISLLDNKRTLLNFDEVRINPQDLAMMNDDYFWIAIKFESSAGFETVDYICRISDGAIFKLNNSKDLEVEIPRSNNWFKKYPLKFRSDKSGDIYFICLWIEMHDQGSGSYEGDIIPSVVKLDIQNPSNLKIKKMTPEIVDFFEVDTNGFIYYTRDNNISRIVSPDGSIQNLGLGENIWLEQDGYLHFIENNSVKIIKFDLNNNVNYEIYGAIAEDINIPDAKQLIKNNCTYFLYNTNLYEVFNSTNTPRTVVLSLPICTFDSYSNRQLISVSDNNYYCAGTNKRGIVKITPETGDYDYILGNNYEIYSISASNSESVDFAALRLSDGETVIGNISNTGIVNVISKESTKEIPLIRIR